MFPPQLKIVYMRAEIIKIDTFVLNFGEYVLNKE